MIVRKEVSLLNILYKISDIYNVFSGPEELKDFKRDYNLGK